MVFQRNSLMNDQFSFGPGSALETARCCFCRGAMAPDFGSLAGPKRRVFGMYDGAARASVARNLRSRIKADKARRGHKMCLFDFGFHM